MAYDSRRQNTTQTIGCTTTSAMTTSAFTAQTRCVRLVSNAACVYAIGDGNQTATTIAGVYLPANWFEYVDVSPGQKIAATRAATDGNNTAASGTLWVTEMA